MIEWLKLNVEWIATLISIGAIAWTAIRYINLQIPLKVHKRQLPLSLTYNGIISIFDLSVGGLKSSKNRNGFIIR